MKVTGSDLQIRPQISEKTYSQADKLNTYVFVVPKAANKAQVKSAIEAQFNVSVDTARTLLAKGKRKSSARKGKRPVEGKRADTKKAYVTVAAGDKITIFEEGS